MSCENLSIILYLKSSMVISNNPSKNPSEGEFLRLTPTNELMKSPESLGPGRWTVGKNVVAPRYTTQIEHYDNMEVPFLCLRKEVWMWGSWRWNAYKQTIWGMPQNPGKKQWENTQSTFLLRDLVYHDYITEMGTFCHLWSISTFQSGKRVGLSRHHLGNDDVGSQPPNENPPEKDAIKRINTILLDLCKDVWMQLGEDV